MANETPALIRLGVAAEKLGLTREALSGAILDGDIPIACIKVGRLTFFRAVELNAWLRGQPAPALAAYDLF